MKKIPVIHPFLFAAYPVVFLLSINVEAWPLRDAFVPLLVLSGLTGGLWFALSWVLGGRQRAGVFVSLFLLLFFSYTPFSTIVAGVISPRAALWMVGMVWVGLLGVATYVCPRMQKDTEAKFTRLFTAVGLFLVVICSVPIAVEHAKTAGVLARMTPAEDIGLRAEPIDATREFPDIYYVVLDGYGRADVLRQLYQYDNEKFLRHLADKGFYIAGASCANYAQTVLSLASSLNLKYLDDLTPIVGKGCGSRAPLLRVIRNNAAMAFVRQRGYAVTAYSSGYIYTEFPNADRHLKTGHLGLFANTLLGNTPLPFFAGVRRWQHNVHRRGIQRTFAGLANSRRGNAPTFVFAHLLVPHPPFVFGKHGEEMGGNDFFSIHDGQHLTRHDQTRIAQYRQGYSDQLAFVNEQVGAFVEKVLVESERRAIIIIQADHGPGSLMDFESCEKTYKPERMSILNAYYLPGGAQKLLYPEISPVNTFRLIGNYYLGANLDLLPDKSFFSTGSHPYDFVDVTDGVRSVPSSRNPGPPGATE